jgi:putative Flp pilus-assembly TadE/G-like protein
MKEHTMVASSRSRDGQSGQALVVMLGVVLVALAMLALIIDGGNVLSQQRQTQTGADATAEAGAILFAQKKACDDANPAGCPPAGGWDAAIAAKLTQSAIANGITIKAAYYTDICGIPLKADGTKAVDAQNREDLANALRVGNPTHSLPGGTATTPDCPSLTVGPVSGVLVLGEKNVSAYVARAINISTFKVDTRATAVAGYLQGTCDASQGNACSLLPVTIPVNSISCNGNQTPTDSGLPWTWNVVLKVPLCSTADGNVGWLDWTPKGGGSSELVCSIETPNNPTIDLPSWQFVTQSGNVNGGGGSCHDSVEDAIRTKGGQIVLIPQFDQICDPPGNAGDPVSTQPAINTAPRYGCPVNTGSGGGSNVWYRMPSFAYFQVCEPSMPECNGLYGAYISGNNRAVCDTGSGATSCLVGKFVDILGSGTVGAGYGGGTGKKAVGVQLIR